VVDPKLRLTRAPRKDKAAAPYDFSCPDRIPVDQVRAMQQVYETLARAFGSCVSAYLHTLVSVSLQRVEQLSFGEFQRWITPPVTVVPLKMHPHNARAILQLSHAAVFPILEVLLGGAAKPAAIIDREITQIERCVFEPVLRLLVQELRVAWQSVSPIEFGIEEHAAPMQIVASIAPAEAFVAVGFELRIGEAAGSLNLGLPSRVIRTVMHDSQTRKHAVVEDCTKMLRLVQNAELNAEVRLNGARVLFRDLMNVEVGDVLTFDHPLGKEVELELNGTPKFRGHVVAVGGKRCFQVKREFRREP
jgi:flagellar motor switch protein FliM